MRGRARLTPNDMGSADQAHPVCNGDVTSAQWAVVEPLLPPEQRLGRPGRDRFRW